VSARRAPVPDARAKPHKVRGRELEEVREKDPDGRIVYHHRTVDTLGKMLRAGTIDQAMHDAGKDFQAAFIVANLESPAGHPGPAGPRHRARAGAQRAPARRAAAGPPIAGGAGRAVQPGGLLCLARRRAAAERARVGNPAGLGWKVGAARAGTGDSSGSTRDAGGALGVRRGEAGVLKDAYASLDDRFRSRSRNR
jgi:hypothetical protein